MNSNTSSSKMQTVGTALSWLVGYAIAAMFIFYGAFVRNNTSTSEEFAHGAGPFLGLSILAAAAVAAVLCIVGIVCWPSQVMRSRRWVLSGIGIVLVMGAAFGVVLVAALITAVQLP